MKFMCFCYYDPAKFNALSPKEMEAVPASCKPHDDALNASGKKVLMGGFAEPETYKTIRPVDGKPTVDDGPYAQTHDQLAVFFLVEAEDIDEAVKIASLHPGAYHDKFFGGGIEVRPCDFFEQAPA